MSGAKSHYRSQVGPTRGPNACLWAFGSLCEVENRVSTQKLPYLKGQNARRFSNFPFLPYSDISDAKSEFLSGFSMSMHRGICNVNACRFANDLAMGTVIRICDEKCWSPCK